MRSHAPKINLTPPKSIPYRQSTSVTPPIFHPAIRHYLQLINMNTNMNTPHHTSATSRRTTHLIKTASSPIATPKIHPPITKQSQFPAAATQISLPNPRTPLPPTLTLIESVNTSPKTPKSLGSILLNLGFGGPFSRVRWPKNPPQRTQRTRPNSAQATNIRGWRIRVRSPLALPTLL